MLAFLDVDYRESPVHAVAACVLAERWDDATPARELLATVAEVAPYEPGRFYLRELPCLLAVLAKVDAPLDAIVIDGHVWLDGDRPGLGARLFEALGEKVPVVGVAKHSFHGATRAVPVMRGESKHELWVTSIGALEVSEAAERVRGMHGDYRIPTLIRRADRAAREG